MTYQKYRLTIELEAWNGVEESVISLKRMEEDLREIIKMGNQFARTMRQVHVKKLQYLGDCAHD